MNGADILVYVNTGTTGSPVWTVVGSQRGVTFEESNEEIDLSSKDGRAARVDYGRYSASVSLEALYVPDDAAYVALKAAARNGDKVQIQREEEGSDLEYALAVITSISEEGPDQDASTVSVDFTIDGEWTAVGS
jgi:TP901-1 family phage major tail protein